MFLLGILDGPLGGGSGSSSMRLLNLLAFLFCCRLKEVRWANNLVGFKDYEQ